MGKKEIILYADHELESFEFNDDSDARCTI